MFDAGSSDAATTDPPAEARLIPCTARERSGDVYSLGAVLYHCLTGRRPFDQADENGAFDAQRRGDLVPVSAIREKMPAEIDAVIAKAMHLDPARRHGSCGELAVAVTQALGLAEDGAALPILRDIQDRLRAGRDHTTAYAQAMPPTGAEPPTSAAQTRNMLLSTLAAVLAVALAGGLLLYQLFDPDDGDGGRRPAAEDPSTSASSRPPRRPTVQLEQPSPTVDPVTGDAQVERCPVEGECVDDDRGLLRGRVRLGRSRTS